MDGPDKPGHDEAWLKGPYFAAFVHATQSMERTFYVYIMASGPDGTLYPGMTNNLRRRIWEHREGLIEGFTKKYGVKRLVYFEIFSTAANAIHREKRIKKYPRAWKINLIRERNPEWKDLAGTLNA